MKIAVLVSGGVDSAVVVHKLFNEGHDLHRNCLLNFHNVRIPYSTDDHPSFCFHDIG